MMALPMLVSETEMDVFIILQSENIDRLMEYDPAELVKDRMGDYAKLGIRNVVITYATDADIATIMPMLQDGNLRDALRHLTRGWQYRQEAGDNDNRYESLRRLQ